MCSNYVFAFCFCCHLPPWISFLLDFLCCALDSRIIPWTVHYKQNYWTLLNNHSEAKVWKAKRAWSWHGWSRSARCTLTRATCKRSWRFQETALLGTNCALFLTQTLLHSCVIEALIDKTKKNFWVCSRHGITCRWHDGEQ